MRKTKILVDALLILTMAMMIGGCDMDTPPSDEEPDTYTLTVMVEGEGQIFLNDKKVDIENDSKEVDAEEGLHDIKAVPKEDWEFSYWEGKVKDITSKETEFTIDSEMKVAAVFGAKSEDFEGGLGTKTHPYQITNANQLNKARDYLNSHFKLIDDINLSEYSDGLGWNPIGDEENPFSGTFDGKDYKIRNLTIDRPTEKHIGLFGYVNDDAFLSNINLEVDKIEGDEYVGGISGYNAGDITNCSSKSGIIKGIRYTGGIAGQNSGKIKESNSNIGVKGDGGASVGGLVGVNIFGEIIECYAEGDVEGLSSTIGGLVGRTSAGIIKNSYAAGNVKKGSNSVGGLVGVNDGGLIEVCYAAGNVEGVYWVGGLAGSNTGSIRESHALGDVDGGGSENIGGLVGYNYNSGNLEESYAQNDVSGGNNIGGLVGYNNEGDILNNYAKGNVEGENRVGGFVGLNDDKIKKGYAASIVTGDEYVGGFFGGNEQGTIKYSYYDKDLSEKDEENELAKTGEEMIKRDTFEPEWDFDNIWHIDEGNSYPYLQWQDENVPQPPE